MTDPSELRIRVAAASVLAACVSQAIGADHHVHQPIVLDFVLDETHELAPRNPFLDYRLQVTFSLDGEEYRVPGHFAADGDAANSGADSGGVWRVIFSPPLSGEWEYRVSFRRGPGVAIEEDPYRGEPVTPYDGRTGTLRVAGVAKDARGFQRSGALVYNGSRYFHTRDGRPTLLFGPNSPENALAFEDFDGTRSADPDKPYLKSWGPHVDDWKEGDPTWGDGRGKGLIGALNYLASQKMNVVYALTMNLEGDSSDVWPFVAPNKRHFTRYDVSKLAQWDIVFSHAESLGVAFELITQEQENQLLLDDGGLGVERKLYYREMISRFGHHGNLIWNIGEENGGQGAYWPQGQNDQQRFAMIRYLKDNDPLRRPVLMHTYATAEERDPIARRLLRFDRFDGLSMQSANAPKVHGEILDWIERSEAMDRPWVIMHDEIGPWHTGAAPDEEDPDHDDLRKDVLWGSLMAGAAGVQWYFGWLTPPHDLNAEDWRSRENLWRQSAVAKVFFERLEYTRMRSADALLEAANGYCFCKPGEEYALYLKRAGPARLDLRDTEGDYRVLWYNPKTGGEYLEGDVLEVSGGGWVELGDPPGNAEADWAILVTRVGL